jgi:cell division septum initiation protein DivIVA
MSAVEAIPVAQAQTVAVPAVTTTTFTCVPYDNNARDVFEQATELADPYVGLVLSPSACRQLGIGPDSYHLAAGFAVVDVRGDLALVSKEKLRTLQQESAQTKHLRLLNERLAEQLRSLRREQQQEQEAHNMNSYSNPSISSTGSPDVPSSGSARLLSESDQAIFRELSEKIAALERQVATKTAANAQLQERVGHLESCLEQEVAERNETSARLSSKIQQLEADLTDSDGRYFDLILSLQGHFVKGIEALTAKKNRNKPS